MSFSQPHDDKLVAIFRHLAVENPGKTIEAGRPIFDDVEVCEVRAPGSRNVSVFPATSMSHWGTDPETGVQMKVTYAERFSHQYKQFKMHQAQTKTGTPLKHAPFLTEARQAELRALNIYTVEALAHIDGQELKNIGPQGRDLKNKAIEYIEQSKANAPNAALIAELEQLRARNTVLEEDNQALLQKRSDNPDANFDGMSDDQLRDFIQAHTGNAPRGDVPRKTLLRMAREATPKAA